MGGKRGRRNMLQGFIENRSFKWKTEEESFEFLQPFSKIKGGTSIRAESEQLEKQLKTINLAPFLAFVQQYENMGLTAPLRQVLITDAWHVERNDLYVKNRVWVLSAKTMSGIIQLLLSGKERGQLN